MSDGQVNEQTAEIISIRQFVLFFGGRRIPRSGMFACGQGICYTEHTTARAPANGIGGVGTMKWIFKILAALALLAAAAAGFSLLFGNDADTQYVTIYDDADGADN